MTVTEARHEAEQRLLGCQSCHLCWMGNGPVPFIGPTPNDIMVLGESPTRTEDKARKRLWSARSEPVVLYERGLKRAGFNRESLFHANAVSCWADNRTPTVAETRACGRNLSAQISLCDPLVILTMGAVPLSVVSDRLGKHKRQVTKDHGQPFHAKAGPAIGRWVWPTFHPAAMKKAVGAETTFLADLERFGQFYRAMTQAGWPDEGIAT